MRLPLRDPLTAGGYSSPFRRLGLAVFFGATIVGCKVDRFLASRFPDPAIPSAIDSITLRTAVPSTAGGGMATDTADGLRIVTLRAYTNAMYDAPGASVSFATTQGSLLGASNAQTVTAPVDEHGIALTQLRVPSDSGVAFISATFAGVTRVDSIRFLPAPPSLVTVTLSALSLDTLSTDTVFVSMTRSVGTQSPGFFVKLTVDQSNIASVTFSSDSILSIAAAASGAAAKAGSGTGAGAFAATGTFTVKRRGIPTVAAFPITITATVERGGIVGPPGKAVVQLLGP